MQGLADGYFVIPYTHRRLPRRARRLKVTTDHDAFAEGPGQASQAASTAAARSRASRRCASSTASSARSVGHVGMARNEAEPAHALERIPELREEFWQNVSVPGRAEQPEQEPRVRRPRRRLPGVRRVLALDALERQRVVRRPLPRGVPDPRRRGAARRRALRARRRPGSSRASASRRCCTRKRWCSSTCTRRSGVTSEASWGSARLSACKRFGQTELPD